MHMSDALLSPAIGGLMWAASVGSAAICARSVNRPLGLDPAQTHKLPLMGVTGAFIFAAQMINFSIPGTGSSGHLGGGMILAALLGPQAGFLVMGAVLLIQALFFADGGLLAFGANWFNLGFMTCFIAYPLIYQKIVSRGSSPRKIATGAILASVVGLQLGAIGVSIETLVSGQTMLPPGAFLMAMLPIHLAIGLVEGVVTASVLVFIAKARPEILAGTKASDAAGRMSWKQTVVIIGILAIVAGALLSSFASTSPDGLEWSVERSAPSGTLAGEASPGALHRFFATLQEKLAFLPDYGFRKDTRAPDAAGTSLVDPGTSVSGLVGASIVLVSVTGIGLLVRRLVSLRRRRNP